VPREQLGKKRLQTRAVLGGFSGSLCAFPQLADRGRGDGRLGDPGSHRLLSGVPDAWAWEVAGIVLPKDDVWEEPVRPLRAEEGLELGPGAIPVEAIEAERYECRIPVPLERIHPAVGHGVTATVVILENRARGGVEVARRHEDPAVGRGGRTGARPKRVLEVNCEASRDASR